MATNTPMVFCSIIWRGTSAGTDTSDASCAEWALSAGDPYDETDFAAAVVVPDVTWTVDAITTEVRTITAEDATTSDVVDASWTFSTRLLQGTAGYETWSDMKGSKV